MSNRYKNEKMQFTFLLVMMLLFSIFITHNLHADPTGATITSSSTDNGTVDSAGSIVTLGGSFTTLTLNTSQQNQRWKAYVGNITGDLRLEDSNNATIYDWELSSITGEVYAVRNNTVDFTSIKCANSTEIATEETYLNLTPTRPDGINNTFNETAHEQFYVGTTLITNSTCRAIAIHSNNAEQNASETAEFQEILLSDETFLVFASIINDDGLGYNGQTYDFQMILPTDEFAGTPTPYYFYAEIG